MRITILTVPDCPNTPVAAERITAALAGRPASVELVEVTGEAEAARLGMTGSPTILLDGVDPFAAAGAVPGLSCRIYRGPDGPAAGAPSVQDLTTALSAAGTAGDECREGTCPIRSAAGGGAAARRPLAGCGRCTRRSCGTSPPLDRPPSRRRSRRRPPRTGVPPGRCWPSWTARTSSPSALTGRSARPTRSPPPRRRTASGSPAARGVVDVRDRRARHPGHARPATSSSPPRTRSPVSRSPSPPARTAPTVLGTPRRGGIRRPPRLLRPGRHSLLRRPQLLHQHSLRPYLGA